MKLPRSYKINLSLFRGQRTFLDIRDFAGETSLEQLSFVQAEDNFLFLLEDDSGFILMET